MFCLDALLGKGQQTTACAERATNASCVLQFNFVGAAAAAFQTIGGGHH
jgi:hypothetical protein